MLQIKDDRDFWIGIGLLGSSLRFSTGVNKDAASKVGFRISRRVWWQGQSPSPFGLMCIEKVLDLASLKFPIPRKNRMIWETHEDIFRFEVLIDRLDIMCDFSSILSDQSGLYMLNWLDKNPAPNEYEPFLEWASVYDDEVEASKSMNN
jgi:hypothetical protein